MERSMVLRIPKNSCKKDRRQGYCFDPENLDIDKDENNAVTIAFTYHDQISFFGMEIKELEFSLEVTEKNIKTTPVT